MTSTWSVLAASAAVAACAGEPELSATAVPAQAALPTVAVTRATAVLHSYDEAPRTADGDDPAIWIHPRDPARSLIIAALKDAGMQVYDLSGRVVQTIIPSSRPPVDAADPPVPGAAPDPGTAACPGSASGETFGRFNNVNVLYDFALADGRHRDRRTPGLGGGVPDGAAGATEGLSRGIDRRVDIAVVTDRGCDRLRIFAIEPGRSGGPLVEITSPRAGRVFPERFVQPSPFQPGTLPAGLSPNDLDEQSTGYGLTLFDPPGRAPRAFVTQRRRARVAELVLVPDAGGTISYRSIREYRFPVMFDVGAARPWTPCREEADEDPQLEGLVVDADRGVLYASQEVVGVWRVPLSPLLPPVVEVRPGALLHRTRSFGAPYWAIPDDDEFECAEPDGVPPDGAIVVPGNPAAGGDVLEADVEGLAIYRARRAGGYLLVSSQGDDTYHVYDLTDPRRRIGSFEVAGTGETDGHEVTNVGLGRAFPDGLFVTQNGEAEPPASTEPINGFEYDSSTQFQLVDWKAIAGPLGLDIDTRSFDPRRGR